MPQVFRLGCAGAALIVIAALTSVGLYAVVAGGVPWAGVAIRTAPGGVPVLVTIQAAQSTPTLALTSTPVATPGPGRPAAQAATAGAQASATGAPGPALAPPAAAPTPTDARQPADTRQPSDPRQPTDTRQPSDTRQPAATAAIAAAAGANAQAPATTTSARAETPTPSAPPDPSQQATHDGLSLEIVEIERGWQATGSDSALIRRRDGSDLLTVQVRFSNEAGELRFVNDADLVLVADDGARLAPRQTAPQREPRLLTVPAPPHEAVRGWLTYDVPAGLEPRRLQWSPTRPDRPRADATYLLTLPR